MKRYYICEAVQYIEPVNGKSEKFAIEIVHVMDEKGRDIKTDCFEREIPQPEPEEEEENAPAYDENGNLIG